MHEYNVLGQRGVPLGAPRAEMLSSAEPSGHRFTAILPNLDVANISPHITRRDDDALSITLTLTLTLTLVVIHLRWLGGYVSIPLANEQV